MPRADCDVKRIGRPIIVAEDVQEYSTITGTCAICPPPEGQRIVRVYFRYYDITDLAMRPDSPPFFGHYHRGIPLEAKVFAI
jgi:hypothetical protein